MYNIGSYNPAVVGSTSYGDAFVNIREQDWGFEDYNGNDISTFTTWLGVQMPLKKLNSGIGVKLTTDKIGFEETQDLRLSYAYQFKVGEGKIGLGVDLGVAWYTFNLDDAVFPNGINGTGSDQWLEERYGSNSEPMTKFVAGAGILYRSKDNYFGISASNFLHSKFDYPAGEVDYIEPTYWITAGYSYQTSNPLWMIKPSALLKTNLNTNDGFGAIAQLSIDLLVQYNKFIIAGVSYTSSSDISPILGVEINNGSKLDGLRLVGAYDISWSDLQGQHNGSFEVTIGYSFNLSIEKVTKSYKSVRFL